MNYFKYTSHRFDVWLTSLSSQRVDDEKLFKILKRKQRTLREWNLSACRDSDYVRSLMKSIRRRQDNQVFLGTFLEFGIGFLWGGLYPHGLSKSVNGVKRQMRDLSHEIGTALQPVFISRKLEQDLKPSVQS